jgi:hypothetical protein
MLLVNPTTPCFVAEYTGPDEYGKSPIARTQINFVKFKTVETKIITEI